MAKDIEVARRALGKADVLIDARRAYLIAAKGKSHEVGHLGAHLSSRIESSQKIASREAPLEHRLERVETALDLLRSLKSQIVGGHRHDHDIAGEDCIERQHAKQRATVDDHRA